MRCTVGAGTACRRPPPLFVQGWPRRSMVLLLHACSYPDMHCAPAWPTHLGSLMLLMTQWNLRSAGGGGGREREVQVRAPGVRAFT